MFEIALLLILFLIYLALISIDSYLKRMADKIDPPKPQEDKKVWV